MAAATAAAMIPDTFSVSVLVFKGDPVDWQRYRHTALCFRPASSSPSPPPTPSPRCQRRDSSSGNEESAPASPPPLIIHAIGAPYEYEIQAIDDYEPRRDPERTLVRDITVGKLRKAVTKEHLISVVSKIPVDNNDSEFNCQTWVEKALKQLSDDDWLTAEEYNNGVDGMVEGIIEAEEEPE
ncbi:hypothetical protein IWX49DRAFT_370373 [Phyllosticta citricarpa]|uniref:Uncharacterized protein n=2 Tax=Phyllosticta TaxID=121621 RepID=A0ABR1MIX8_9PEZI